ncbi:hypothetical protein ACM66B_000326 [Microbotryomycetes sp. NB124-2]
MAVARDSQGWTPPVHQRTAQTFAPADKVSSSPPALGPLPDVFDSDSINVGVEDSEWSLDALQSAGLAGKVASPLQHPARPFAVGSTHRSQLDLTRSSPADAAHSHARAQEMTPSLSTLSSTTADVPSLGSSSAASEPSPAPLSPDRSRADSHSLHHRRRQSTSFSLLPAADLSSPAGSATSFLTASAAPSPVGYTHRSSEASWFAEQQSSLMAHASYAQPGVPNVPSTPPRIRAGDHVPSSTTPRAIAATGYMYRSPSAQSSISSPAASPFLSAQQPPPISSSHAMQAGLSQMSAASHKSSPSASAVSGSSLAAFDTPSRARFSRMALDDKQASSQPGAPSLSASRTVATSDLESMIPLAELAAGAVPVQLEATKEMEQLLDELGQYLPTDAAANSSGSLFAPSRPPAPLHTVSAPSASASNTIEINGVSLAPEDLALLDSTDFNEPVRQYPSSAPPWQTTFDHRPPATPPPHRAVSRPQSHFVIPQQAQAPPYPAQRVYMPHTVAARPATYHESSSYYQVPAQISGQRRRRSSIDYTGAYLHPSESDNRQRSMSANPDAAHQTAPYAYEQTFRIPRPDSRSHSHYGSFDSPAHDAYLYSDGTPTTPRRYARVPARSPHSPSSRAPQQYHEATQLMTPPRAASSRLALTRSLSARSSPAKDIIAASPSRRARSPIKPPGNRRTNSDAGSSTSSSAASSSQPSSPTKPRQSGGSGGGGSMMFINYSAQDKKKLLSGVAPSGSSKRKREADVDKHDSL